MSKPNTQTQQVPQQLFTQSLIPIYLLDQRLRINFTVIQKRLDTNQQTIHNHQIHTQKRFNQLNSQINQIKQRLQMLVPYVQKQVQKAIFDKMDLAIVTKLNQFKDGGFFGNSSSFNTRDIEQTINRYTKQMKGDIKMDILKQNDILINSRLMQMKKQLIKNKSARSEQSEYRNQGGAFHSEKQLSLINSKLQLAIQQIKQMKTKTDRHGNLIQLNQKRLYDNFNNHHEKISAIFQQIKNYQEISQIRNNQIKANMNKLQIKLITQLGRPINQSTNMNTGQASYSQDAVLSKLQSLMNTMDQMLTKTQFQTLYWSKLKKSVQKNQQQVISLKKQFDLIQQANIYSSKTQQKILSIEDNLSNQFYKLKQMVIQHKKNDQMQIKKIDDKVETRGVLLDNDINVLKTLVQTTQNTIQIHQKQIKKFNNINQVWKKRIVKLQYLNNYQQYIDQIHEVLDKPYIVTNNSPNKKRPLLNANKHLDIHFQEKIQFLRSELRDNIESIKASLDDIRLIQARKQDIHEIWKALNILQGRIDMNRGQSGREQRRMSTDKNNDNGLGKLSVTKNLESMINRKLQPMKLGIGQKQSSSKNLRSLADIRDDKLDKIKYSTQSVRLPDLGTQALILNNK